MAIYRWSNSATTAWPSMTGTSLLNDGSVGDTATYETAQDSDSVNTRPTLTLIALDVTLVGQIYLESAHSLTAATAKVVAVRDTTAVGSECVVGEDSPTAAPDSGAWSLQAWDGGAWVEVDNGSLTVVSMGEGSESTSISASFTARRSCWLRLTLTYHLEYVTCEGGLSGSLQLSDFRYTGTNTGVACAEGDDGGDGPDDPVDEGDPIGDPTETGTSSCVCDDWVSTERVTQIWAGTARSCSSWSPSARATVTWTYNDPCPTTEFIYLIDDDGQYLVDSDLGYLLDG